MRKGAWILGVVLAVVAIAIVWLVVRPPRGQGDARSIRVGAISPFTGEGARYGHAARTGIDLAVDEINAKGGVKGAKILVQYEDDRGNQADAVSAFNKLVSVDRVPAVLGPFYSGNVLACAPIADRSKVVLLTGSATSDNVRGAGRYVFRVCPSNDEQARTIADYAFKILRFRSAFVIYRNVDYGVTLRDAFDKAFKGAGGKIVGVEAVPADAGDVRAQLTMVKQASPDFIFAAVHFPEGGVLLRQAKELGITAAVMGTDGGHDPELLKIAGNAAEGSYWATMGWGNESSNPAIAAFRAAYRLRFGEDPGVYSGLYYDATMVLAEALGKAESIDDASIRAALTESDYEGVTGRNRFDDRGDVTKPFAIYQVRNARFVPVSQ
jgi:branched-chain amino acid transport system substrate-binding protein